MKEKIRAIKDFDKIVAAASLVILIITCAPPIFVGFFNYATGDDLLYGSVVKRALAEGVSLSEIFRRVWADFVAEYYSFQGTWSSQLLWRFEPSIWGEKIYIVTIFIAVFFLAIGTYYFAHTFLVELLNLPESFCIVSVCWVLFYSFQYMPYPRGGLYWFTGMTHYTMPYGMVLIAIAWSIKYINKGTIGYLLGVIFILTYIGGSGYPSVVISGVGVFYCLIWGVLKKREFRSRALRLFIPLILLAIGFIISAAAPGNANRGGEDYYFSIGRVFYVIGKSYYDGIIGLLRYFIDVRPLFLLPVGLFIFSLGQNVLQKVRIKHIILFVVFGISIVCLIRSPEVFAGTTVKAGISGGVYDTYFYVSLLFVSGLAILLGGLLGKRFSESRIRLAKPVFIAFAVLFWILAGRHLIGNSLDYTCYKYIASGELADYEDQMQQRFEILNASDEDAVILPFINNEQGPLMHMPVTVDPTNYTNTVTAKFYGKKTVIGMERKEWEAEYGR